MTQRFAGPKAPQQGLTAAEVVRLLGLRPHPEGGHYRQTFEDGPGEASSGEASSGEAGSIEPGPGAGGRAHSTAIYYLLAAGELSAWHRIDAPEVWHHYAGAPLELSLSADGEALETVTLGADLAAGERPQAVVPAGCWQSAVSLGDWTLVGCTVAPGFRFAGFELAAPGWRPRPAR